MIEERQQQQSDVESSTGTSIAPEEIFKQVLYTVCTQKGTANALHRSFDEDFSLFVIATEEDLRNIYTENKFTMSERWSINKLYYYCQINNIFHIELLQDLTKE